MHGPNYVQHPKADFVFIFQERKIDLKKNRICLFDQENSDCLLTYDNNFNIV